MKHVIKKENICKLVDYLSAKYNNSMWRHRHIRKIDGTIAIIKICQN